MLLRGSGVGSGEERLGIGDRGGWYGGASVRRYGFWYPRGVSHQDLACGGGGDRCCVASWRPSAQRCDGACML